MMMVVGLHYFNGGMGGALSQLAPSHYNFYITYFLESMFLVGVNCFVLITGYFQIGKATIKLNKVFELLAMTVFYGTIFYLLSVAMGWQNFNVMNVILAAIPFLLNLKWFIRTFLILYLLIPFINAGLNVLDERKYRLLLITLVAIFSVYPSFIPNPPVTDNGYGIITFVMLYAIGGYLKKYHIANRSKSFYIGGYALCGIITFAFSLLSYSKVPGWLEQVWGYNFIFTLIGSTCLFLFFSKINLTSDTINRVAKYALGVYFIHTDPALNDFLYGKVLNTSEYWLSPWFLAHLAVSIVLVYVASTLIDRARKWLFDRIESILSPFLKKKLPVLWKQVP